MYSVGHVALVVAWLLCIYSVVSGLLAVRASDGRRLELSAGNSLLASSGLTILSVCALAVLFLQHRYEFAYVWQNSDNAMHPFYLISAVWGGMDGSLLLWSAFLGVYAIAAMLRFKSQNQALKSYVIVFLSGGLLFFNTVVLFLTNPFRLIPNGAIPSDGQGLNPLLQNPSMLIHPLTLYLGFTGFSVSSAYCLAALASKNLDESWFISTRRWTLVAWAFLTAGIILGGNWAYIELGWGGFWAWDPVENASFLPWLTATAFLHSVMVQERRGIFKVWNIILCVGTYLLTVFGTFLTRSGLVQSVHAFAETDVGWVFLVYIFSVLGLFVYLLLNALKELAPENKLESYLSREAAFLFNNLFLVGICFATFWGVMYPVITEALFNEKSVVGAPYFNTVTSPLFLGLLFFMGVGPLIAWRRSSWSVIKKLFMKPFIFGCVVFILCLVLDFERFWSALSFGLCTFAGGAILGEFHRGMKARKELAEESFPARAVNLVKRRPRLYGAHIIHLAVVIMFFSITASMVYKQEKDFSIKLGESFEIGRYEIQLKDLVEQVNSNYSALVGTLLIKHRESGEILGELYPEQRVYFTSKETTSEVDIRMTLYEDLYVALGGLEAVGGTIPDLTKTRATFKVFVNPMQLWLWVGSLLLMFGTALVLIPQSSKVAVKSISSNEDTSSVKV